MSLHVKSIFHLCKQYLWKRGERENPSEFLFIEDAFHSVSQYLVEKKGGNTSGYIPAGRAFLGLKQNLD